MTLKKFAGIAALLLLLNPFYSFSQDLDSLLNLSAFTAESELQKALNKGTTVSSSKALSLRETPGIISVVTAEEIQNSGARDINDVLRLIPGFDIVQDLQFIQGIGLRGNWANEGKVLVMMDGIPFNDLLYQTVAIGNRFPVDAIERIEIIRGPGSAIYGGSAEYGVINILTKAAETLNGISVYGTGGFHQGAVGRTNGGIMAAQKGQKFSWDLGLFAGNAIVSDGTYQDLYQVGEPGDLAEISTAEPLNVNLGFKYKGLSIRGMYDEFYTKEVFTFVSFRNTAIDVKYDIKANNKFTITPQFKYFNQIPWQYGSAEDGTDSLKARAIRTYGSVTASYDLSRKVNLNVGLVAFNDRATDMLQENYFLGENKISFNNVALFAQGLIKHRLANATIGFRYERNNQYGSAFVPRIALTKKIENFHFKALYSQAFRAPAIENINLAVSGDGTIDPEKSNVFELELGYQFTPEMLLAVNAFSLSTKDIIVYGTDGSSDGTYENYPKSGSAGLELIYSVRKKSWYSHVTYSYSKPITSGEVVETYLVPQTRSQYVGFPSHKVTLNTALYVKKNISVNPTLIYSGKRYSFNELDSDGEAVSVELPSYVLANLFVNFNQLFSSGLSAGIGVYDLLNEKPPIPQAYNGGYAAIPGRSREYVLKLSYRFDFKK